MANTLGVYNPIFYAQEALIHLRKNLGLASRVYRSFEAERRQFGLGDTVKIRRPSTFTAANAPASASDLNTETVTVTLDQWKEVKFSLTDKELAYTGDRIISDHIAPAAYALADDVDQALAELTYHVPHSYQAAGDDLAVADIVGVRKTMVNNNAPVGDAGNMHLMVGPEGEADLLKLSEFSQQQGAGDVGVSTQLTGSLGRKFGFEVFQNQNTKGALAVSHTDGTGAVNNAAGYAINATSIAVDAMGASELFEKGSVFTIAGDTQKYSLTADSTMSGGAGTLNFAPGLKSAAADDAVVTFDDTGITAGTEIDLAFHRNAFALIMVPLPDMPDELGANVAVVSDPVSGISVRSRIYYLGNTSEVHVALDTLYGVVALDPNLACRLAD